jgi:hypothetical protein
MDEPIEDVVSAISGIVLTVVRITAECSVNYTNKL